MDWQAVLRQAMGEAVADNPIRSNAAESLSLPTLTGFDADSVTACWEVDERFLNSRGALFGGYYGVLFDAVGGLAAMTVLREDEHFQTIDLRISYFRPVHRGTLGLYARVAVRTRTRVHVEITMTDADRRVLATATAVQHVTGGR